MIDVVIVSDASTGYHLTQQAIATCKAERIIVVEQQPVAYEGAITVHYEGAFNYNRCLNLGYQHTENNVAFCNNDLVFYDWKHIERMLNEYGSLSPRSEGWFKHKGLEGVIEGYEIGRHLCGWCLVVSRMTMAMTGGFDEGVEFYFSDNLWADQLRFHGIRHALDCESRVDHLVSKTLLQQKSLRRKELESGQIDKYNEARKRYIN